MQEPDKELSRTLITLLEAVELVPKVEAAVIAKYPRLLMRLSGRPREGSDYTGQEKGRLAPGAASMRTTVKAWDWRAKRR
jgi:hypothetical protein